MLTRKRAKVFLAIAATPAVILCVAALLVNAYVDPLWVLPKIGGRPLHYCVKDERLNKINRAVHGRLDTESVLVGSSRSAFMDTTAFESERVFNMAVNGVQPVEYGPMVEVYSRFVGKPKTVFVGVDFFGYARNRQRGYAPR